MANYAVKDTILEAAGYQDHSLFLVNKYTVCGTLTPLERGSKIHYFSLVPDQEPLLSVSAVSHTRSDSCRHARSPPHHPPRLAVVATPIQDTRYS